MKKILVLLLLVASSCEPIYYEPELVEGQCYIFEPPIDFINPNPDTIWIVSKEKEYVLICLKSGKQVFMKNEGLAAYLRVTSLCNCNYEYN